MQYLVEMKLASSSRPVSPQEGAALIERFIFPTLERCKKLLEENRILTGGPVSGAVAPVLIVSAKSAEELDALITSLPPPQLRRRLRNECKTMYPVSPHRLCVRADDGQP